MKMRATLLAGLTCTLWSAPAAAQVMYRCMDMYNNIYTQDHMSPGCTPFAQPPPGVNFSEIDAQADQIRRNRYAPQGGNGFAAVGAAIGAAAAASRQRAEYQRIMEEQEKQAYSQSLRNQETAQAQAQAQAQANAAMQTWHAWLK